MNQVQAPANRQSQQLSTEPRGWYSRGFVPHLDTPGLLQHVSFHLADSLPRNAIERMEAEIADRPESERQQSRHRNVDAMLDAGLGTCALRQSNCAEIMQDTLLFGDGNRYRLLAWVVMPNHVHALIEQVEGWPLAKLVQGWKRHSARQINQLRVTAESKSAECNSAIPVERLARDATPLWQREYWDRYIRDDRHYRAVERYIEQNPVKAGLVAATEDWPWGSARLRRTEP